MGVLSFDGTREEEEIFAMDDLDRDRPDTRLLPDRLHDNDDDAPLGARCTKQGETTELGFFVIFITFSAGICSLLGGCT